MYNVVVCMFRLNIVVFKLREGVLATELGVSGSRGGPRTWAGACWDATEPCEKGWRPAWRDREVASVPGSEPGTWRPRWRPCSNTALRGPALVSCTPFATRSVVARTSGTCAAPAAANSPESKQYTFYRSVSQKKTFNIFFFGQQNTT